MTYKTPKERFGEPESVQAAEDREIVLFDAISSIQVQLQTTTVEDHGGLGEYNKWRKQALWSLSYKQVEYKYLKQWVKDRNKLVDYVLTNLSPEDMDNPRKLLCFTYQLCRKRLDMATLSSAELAVLDTVQRYLCDRAS